MMNNSVEIAGLRVVRGGRTVLPDLDLDVPAGQVDVKRTVCEAVTRTGTVTKSSRIGAATVRGRPHKTEPPGPRTANCNMSGRKRSVIGRSDLLVSVTVAARS